MYTCSLIANKLVINYTKTINLISQYVIITIITSNKSNDYLPAFGFSL